MKTLRNLSVLIFYFLVFFLTLSFFYFIHLVEPFNYILTERTDELMKNIVIFFSNYIFSIFVLASSITILILGSLVKLSGKISVFVSIFIFSILLSLYPCYTYFFGKVKTNTLHKNAENIETIKYLDASSFTDYENYSLYAESKIENTTYKGIIAIENGFSKPVYFADYATLYNDNILLEGVKVVSVNERAIIASTNLPVTVYKDKYAKKLFSYMFSRLILFPYIYNLFDLYTSKTAPIYSMAIVFVALFLFLLGSYLLTASLSSPYHKYHNVLTAISIYYAFFIISVIVIKVFNISTSDINNASFLFVSIIIISIGLGINIFSVILNKILKISHYKG